jgi:hypothetical protein
LLTPVFIERHIFTTASRHMPPPRLSAELFRLRFHYAIALQLSPPL